jgi:hypothetical protein
LAAIYPAPVLDPDGAAVDVQLFESVSYAVAGPDRASQ